MRSARFGSPQTRADVGRPAAGIRVIGSRSAIGLPPYPPPAPAGGGTETQKVLRTDFPAALDLTAVSAGGRAAALDELLEPLQVALYPVADETKRRADLLSEPFRLVVHHQGDQSPVRPHRLEADEAGVRGAVDALPGDDLVRRLLDDLGVRFLDL